MKTLIFVAWLGLTGAFSGMALAADPPAERRYCTQFGPFVFHFDPDKAAGIFAINRNNDLGVMVGALEGHTLKGEWVEVDSRGAIEVTFGDDWSRFDARYNVGHRPGDWYDGWIGIQQPPSGAATFVEDDVTFYCE